MVSSSMPSANAVARAWNAAGREWVDEWGFSCFACGRWEPEWEGCKASFRGLERAHLLGKQFGGTNEADNFALLCKRCHQDSPDTPDTNDIMGWIVHPRIVGALPPTLAVFRGSADTAVA